MAVWSEVFSSEIVSEIRSDAEFFQPKYEELKAILNSLPVKEPLGLLANFIKKGIFDISPNRYQSYGIPLIRTYQIKTSIVNEDNLVYIDDKDHNNEFRKTELNAGDVVFTKVGAGVGDVGILPNKFAKYNFSQNVAGISIKRGKINPYFLTAFLNSHYGRKQILRYMMPSGQGKLELRDIKKIEIPRFGMFESKIAALVESAESTMQLSRSLYTQAQELLEHELGLDKLFFERPLAYEARFSELMENNRADADYYQKKYKQLDLALSRFPNKKIRQLSEPLTTGVYSSSYTDNGRCYIRGADIKKSYIDIRSLYHSNCLNPTHKSTVIENDILVTRVGSIGVCGIVEPKLSGSFYSDNLIRIRLLKANLLDINPSYLNLLLNTIVGQMRMVRFSRGSVQQRLNQTQLAEVPIPIISKTVQDEIHRLLEHHKKAKLESEQLLEQAKQRVEELIEQAVQKGPGLKCGELS